MSCLHDYLTNSARRRPDAPAVLDPGIGHLTYRELNDLANRVRDRLFHLGVRPGDRVGLCLRKSIDAVAAIFGIQKAGAVHVPVDAGAPAERNAYIFGDCAVRAIIGEHTHLEAMLESARATGGGSSLDGVLQIALHWAGTSSLPLRARLAALEETDPAPSVDDVKRAETELAYILYTSGSTGRPKGVQISQSNALCFIEWCSTTFGPTESDRFSSHAPFHFDLSILDIYVPLKHGATLVLVNEQTGKDPVTMAQLISEQKITSWYSAPSILCLLVQFGHLERFDFSALRYIHFAGEVFPVKHLRALQQIIPHPRYFNLYGPTETNVCTYFEIPSGIPDDREDPYPIGRVCEHFRHRVVDGAGGDAGSNAGSNAGNSAGNSAGSGTEARDVPRGEEGELWIAGPGVMIGYWNQPARNAEVFRTDPHGTRWYRTGDIVVEAPDGNFVFHGRRDRMVKKRGYRIELGEIEAGLYKHPDMEEAAVLAATDHDGNVTLRAYLVVRGTRPSVIQLKRFCADNLVSYMIPDVFVVLDHLPRTSTDKIDYQRLKEMP